MQYFLMFTIFKLIVNAENVQAQFEVQQKIKEELKDLNATCKPLDTCSVYRDSESLLDFACHCDSACVQMRTCCYDSNYASVLPSKLKQSCRAVYNGKTYFMVDRCSSNNSIWVKQCKEDWDGDDDILKIVPVTSLFSLITYKNFFCFRCNEGTEDFYYWNVRMKSYSAAECEPESGQISLRYDKATNTWEAPVGKGRSYMQIQVSVEIPKEVESLVKVCLQDVISHCSDTWSDLEVRDKCDAYMAIMHIDRNGTSLTYRNVHCALCNFEDLVHMSCKRQSNTFRVTSRIRMSFSFLLDINRSDGDRVGRVDKCRNGFVWDPFASKCRRVTCAFPGHVVKDGKCVLG